MAKFQFQGKPSYFLVHIETQAQKQAEFALRMHRYFSLLFQKFGLPVYPVVIFSHQGKVAEPDHFTMALPDITVLQFRFKVIQLARLSWRDFIQRKNPVVCALMSKMGVRPEDRVRVKLECLRMLLTLKVDKVKQHFLGVFIDTYLRLNAAETLPFKEEANKLPMVQEGRKIMKLMTSWEAKGMERGLEQGRQEGLEQGLQEGQLALVSRMLQRRFGPLPSKMGARLKKLACNQLGSLAEALLDFRSKADLEAWLLQNNG